MQPKRTGTRSSDESDGDATSQHYLKEELDELVRTDPAIFEFIQEAALDGLWYWDAEHPDHEWLSPGFKRFFGYADHEMENSPAWWQTNIDPDDLEVVMENYRRHCEDPTHPYDQVVRYRHRDGTPRWVRCRGVAIRDDQGRPIRLLGAHTDVTDLKETEIRLARTAETLRRFAHSVAHDLRSPLTVIAGFAEVIEREVAPGVNLDPDILRDAAERLKTAAFRAASMIDDILDYSVAGVPVEAMGPVQMDDVVEWVRESVSDALKGAGAELITDSLPEVAGNEAALRQVVLNVVSNSIKFRSEERPLRIHISNATAHDGDVELVFDDNGVGIPLDERHSVFKLGSRRSNGDIDGYGIGLATCRLIASHHGGRIEAGTPADGVGTRIVLTLPAS